ncbi:MAG: Gfo/Idh/MocA family protein [Janthinobacterium lividum]
MTKFLRVALVGCGLISEEHIRAYAAHAERAQITVCYDIDTEKSTRRAEALADARVASSLEDILADPNVDALEICTPPHLHPEIVIAAAKAGKHVMCQKPLARTVAECDTMIAAAHDAGTVLFYGETNRTLPAALEAKRVIDAGRIGRLVGIQARFAYWQQGAILNTAWRYDPAVAGGGQLLDSGIHSLALMHVLGGPVEAVSCFTHRFRPEMGGEDTTALSLQFQGGHIGTLFSSQAVGIWVPGPGLTVFGTEGALTLSGGPNGLTLHRHDLPAHSEVLPINDINSFEAMIGSYLDTVLDGADNLSPGEAGREDLQLVLTAYQSAAEGQQIRL